MCWVVVRLVNVNFSKVKELGFGILLVLEIRVVGGILGVLCLIVMVSIDLLKKKLLIDELLLLIWIENKLVVINLLLSVVNGVRRL